MGVPKTPTAGIAFPLSAPGRSPTAFATVVLADAVRRHDADLAQSISATRHWRHDYIAVFRALTALSASAPSKAAGIATDGIRSAHSLLRFVDDNGTESPLDAVNLDAAGDEFDVETIEGTGKAERVLRVPVNGTVLEGDALRRKLHDWRERGVAEPSFVVAVERVIDNPEWLALPGFRVVLVGAGAEVGPYLPLVGWGADVLAVDLPGEQHWQPLVAAARAGAGVVRYPVRAGTPGADVAHSFPELLQWIYANTTKRGKLVFGMYARADEGANVTATAAADMIARDILAKRSKASLAYLASPTDCFAVGTDVMAEARRRWHERGVAAPVQDVLRFATRSNVFGPNYIDEVVDRDGTRWGLANALMSAQGPNHALTKRLQRWRGVLTRAAGRGVSFNVAPLSRTASVTRDRRLAATCYGASRFGIEFFEPETTRVLMAAKLVADLFAPEAGAAETNPEELFCEGALHGGLWRQPFDPGSVLGVAAASGLPRTLVQRH